MSDPRPLFQRLRGEIVILILEERVGANEALPSVRSLAAQMGVNPLTVAKAYSVLQVEGVIEARRGVGFFLTSGGRCRLIETERARFLAEEWPAVTRDIRRLGLSAASLLDAKVP